ncbi:helix-turn-helix domain-containing protein [Streptomyces sp. NPDC093111]|uniref:helix-turn-helix domain-containing protein n=1 Tax=Streptomyces sp. NPDC093111 TaxID=3154978 RepID=UPI00342219C5
MTLTAIALSCHIQSLPEGAGVSIRSLAAHFPEGEVRIATALRELERHGYLERLRVRLPNGRVITRTMAYTVPKRAPAGDPAPPTAVEPLPQPPAAVEPEPQQDPEPDPDPTPEPDPDPDPDPPSGGAAPPPPPPPPPPVREAAPRPPKPARPPVQPLPEGPAAELLLGLRAQEPRLTLSVRDVLRLAPGVDAWFARGATPDAVRRTLTACLPADLKHPAGILDYRLTSLLPPPLPAAPVAPPAPDPFQTCDDCERAFRAPEPGLCRDCREERRASAA